MRMINFTPVGRVKKNLTLMKSDNSGESCASPSHGMIEYVEPQYSLEKNMNQPVDFLSV